MANQMQFDLEQFDVVHRFLTTLSRADALPEVYDAALETLVKNLPVEQAAILIYDATNALQVGATHAVSDSIQQSLENASLWTTDDSEPEPWVTPNGVKEPELSSLYDKLRAEGLQAFALIPLVCQNQLLGVLFLGSAETEKFTDAVIQFAEDVGNHVSFAIDRMQTHASLARFRTISDNANETHFIINRSGRLVYANRAASKALGYSEQELLRMHISEVVPDFPPTAFRQVFKKSQKQSIQPFEAIHRRQDGSTYPVEVTLTNLSFDGDLYLSASARDISERKQAEMHQREHVQLIETLQRLGSSLVSDLDLRRVVQEVTTAATELTGAEFGAFFYNVTNQDGESYQLYTLAGAPAEAFSKFPQPRNTAIFGPTFAGTEVIRLDDVKKDPRYGQNAPYYGMPQGHLPVSSYLAVPVISRSGEVIGGLFFGHQKPGMFTDYHERITVGIAGWAAVSVDNARLYEYERRAKEDLELRVAERTHELRKVNERLQREKVFVQLLQKITAAANEARTAREAFQFALDELCAQISWPIGHAYLTHPSNGGELVSSHIWHIDKIPGVDDFRRTTEASRFERGLGLPGRVLATGQPIWLDEIADDNHFGRFEQAKQIGICSGFAFPVMVGKDIAAVLEFFSDEKVEHDAELLEICANIGAQLGRVVERDRAELSRRQLTRQVVSAQEKERRRLSRELHDAAGQMLTALMINLSLLEQRLGAEGKSVSESVTESKELAGLAYEEIRAVSHALRPPSLDKSGLSESLQALCVDFARQTGLEVEYEGEEPEAVAEDVAITFYRFLQEALANVVKHAQATMVHVELTADNGELRLQVTDDGVGFEVDEASRSTDSGVGILGLEERFDLLGGYLRVESGPGEGTRVIGACSLGVHP